MNTIKVNHEKRTIEMDRTFYNNSLNARSDEYKILQQVRSDYPNYTPVQKTIKKNPNKNTYSGLNYKYMEDYILTHEPAETRDAVLDEFHEKILISKCHSKAFRYPTIKKWFLDKYPQIKEFAATTEKPKTNDPLSIVKAAGF